MDFPLHACNDRYLLSAYYVSHSGLHVGAAAWIKALPCARSHTLPFYHSPRKAELRSISSELDDRTTERSQPLGPETLNGKQLEMFATCVQHSWVTEGNHLSSTRTGQAGPEAEESECRSQRDDNQPYSLLCGEHSK